VSPPLDHLDTNTKYEYLGRPLKIALASDLWRQGEPVKAASVPLRLLTDQVYIGDFSLATKAGTDVRHKVLSPLHIGFYAPERFHDVNPSFASDMWSYMCFCSELSFGFVPWQNDSFSLMITKMVGVLGPLPRKWRGLLQFLFINFRQMRLFVV
jgi:serine/threonine protein kinase